MKKRMSNDPKKVVKEASKRRDKRLKSVMDEIKKGRKKTGR